MNNGELIKLALGAREKAYSPYSGFRVGAALLCKNGKVFTGCNIENSGFSATNCAERTAIFKAVSEGETEFEKIAVVGGKAEDIIPSDYCAPCGICRQVMREFCDGGFEIIIAKNETEYKSVTLGELLPMSFDVREF
ncbi:MAG: cytidine deaminase [Clostridia bacterium]|nr:cytidine deaminase [Clostridia bacterium]